MRGSEPYCVHCPIIYPAGKDIDYKLRVAIEQMNEGFKIMENTRDFDEAMGAFGMALAFVRAAKLLVAPPDFIDWM